MPEPRFLDRVRTAVRTRHYSRRTEEAYIGWTKRFILFHRKRHPAAMGADEVNAFLSNLAVVSALVFLYRHVLDDPLPWIDDIIRARRSRKLPVVLTREEVRSLLAAMKGTPRLVAAILYASSSFAKERERRTVAPCFPTVSSSRCMRRSSGWVVFTARISPRAGVRSGCLTRWNESTRMPHASSAGNISSPHRAWLSMRGAASSDGIISTSRLCSER